MSIALTIRPMIGPPHPPQTSPLRFAASIRGFDSVCCIFCVCGWCLRCDWGGAEGPPGRDICGTDGASSAPPTLIDGIPPSLSLSSPKDIRGRAGGPDEPGPEILIAGPSKSSSSSLSPSALAGNEIFGIRGVPDDSFRLWVAAGAGGWKRTGDCDLADGNDLGVGGPRSNCCRVGDTMVDCHCLDDGVVTVVCHCFEGDEMVVFHCGFAGEGGCGCCVGAAT